MANFSIFELSSNDGFEHNDARIDVNERTLLTTLASQIKPEHVTVLTDRFEYKGWDQVIPIQPEQVFFYDYFEKERLHNKHVLEIGLGSGILSIKAAKLGAKSVVALDINPRARAIGGFNVVINNVQDIVDIRSGCVDDIYQPVKNEKFDYIISNPPFEPTPENENYYLNSAAGIYGLDFLHALFNDLTNHLNENGFVQIVTMAPGNKKEPFLLTRMLEQYFPNQEIIVDLDHQPIGYNQFVDRFVDIFDMDPAQVEKMKVQASKDQVTDIFMVMICFEKGKNGSIQYRHSKKLYENWTTPLGKEQSLIE